MPRLQRERDAAEARFNEKTKAEAEAAAALERQRQADEAERQKRESLERSIASDAKTALIVALLGTFCVQIIFPLGFYLAIRARRRAKKEAPHMVPTTNTAYYLSWGIIALAGLILGLVLIEEFSRR